MNDDAPALALRAALTTPGKQALKFGRAAMPAPGKGGRVHASPPIAGTDAERGFANRQAIVVNHTLSTRRRNREKCLILLGLLGERGGTRTLDPMIKSQ
jgi:hypothetical protein